MALKDYAEIDEDDYYGQNFEKDGKVSIWLGFSTDEDDPEVMLKKNYESY